MTTRPGRPASAAASILERMLSSLRNARGGPSFRVRVVAVLLVAGLVLTAAPLFVEVVRWLLDALAFVLF